LYKISEEIEQKFFGRANDAGTFQPEAINPSDSPPILAEQAVRPS
jgi:hypothetical protein